ncbi:hypothetical protein BD560DRAFT_494035 [Blakeslea trispora]|nr:hypothetical protein BD560DRAFT_494035 [Blakeslea trispora]
MNSAALSGISVAINPDLMKMIEKKMCLSFYYIYPSIYHKLLNQMENYSKKIPQLRLCNYVCIRHRCEAEFYSTKTLNLAAYDYDFRGAPASKNFDALGILSTQNKMDGRLKEHTSHTIEDIGMWNGITKKKQAINYKNASLNTFNKLKVHFVHITKTQHDNLNVQLTQKELTKENLELVSSNGLTIGSTLKEFCFNSHPFYSDYSPPLTILRCKAKSTYFF